MAIQFPSLPYSNDALSPHISARTLEFHHGKHHKKYVDTANELIQGTEYENQELESIIKKTAGNPNQIKIFNNAAQAWNHSFYWQCMKPNGGGTPTGPVADKIKADFGSFDKFVDELKNAGATQFGSGWAWLVIDSGKLKTMKTLNADTPIAHNLTPLLTVDVWEHAYYLDYQNRRPDYLSAFIQHLINWDFVNGNL